MSEEEIKAALSIEVTECGNLGPVGLKLILSGTMKL